jgi:hypothetical protein
MVQLLMFLGVNRNVKREWQTMHRAFGGIGLFSFPVEQTIGMINMLIQHYGAGTTLAKKMSTSIEALQLAIGCTGSPFVKNYEEFYLLATLCWTKSLWERLHCYKFRVHLDYPPIPLPRKGDVLLVCIFRDAGYRDQQQQALNRCRLALKLLFLSDIATTCGHLLNISLVLKPARPNKSVSEFVFPNEHPSPRDWKLWLELWTAFAGPGWGLRNPLGAWEHPTHWQWEWLYNARDDLLLHLVSNMEIIAYSIPGEGHCLRSRQIISALARTRSSTLTLPPGNRAGIAWKSDPLPGNWASSCCTPPRHQLLLDSPPLDGGQMDVGAYCQEQHRCRLNKGRACK